MALDTELLRWILLLGAAPLWWPFLRMLWKDFNDTLAEEGGLLGRPPGPREMQRLREERAKQPDPLVSEPWARPGERGRRTLRRASETRQPPRAKAPESASFERKPRQGGF